MTKRIDRARYATDLNYRAHILRRRRTDQRTTKKWVKANHARHRNKANLANQAWRASVNGQATQRAYHTSPAAIARRKELAARPAAKRRLRIQKRQYYLRNRERLKAKSAARYHAPLATIVRRALFADPTVKTAFNKLQRILNAQPRRHRMKLARQRRSQREHPEKWRGYQKTYQQRHPELVRQRARDYYYRNLEACRRKARLRQRRIAKAKRRAA